MNKGEKSYLFFICGLVSCVMILVLSLMMINTLSDLLLAVFADGLIGVLFYLAHLILNDNK